MPNNKTFILDTSVLLHSASSIRSFQEESVVIPYVVLEELDKFKSGDDSNARNARQVIRDLNTLRDLGDVRDGVEVNDAGGILRVELNFTKPQNDQLKLEINDDRILNVCLGLQSQDHNVVLVTKDINLAVRADLFGVEAQDFHSDKLVTTASDIYSGAEIITVPDSMIDSIYGGESIPAFSLERDVLPNQYFTLKSETDPTKSALVRVQDSASHSLMLVRSKMNVWGVSARNREQLFAMDALLDPNIPLVTLAGPAGCGKTLMSLAAGLELVQDRQAFDRLIISRPVQPMGKDLGYLPGSIQEKVDPWMGPIKDSLDYLTRGRGRSGNDIYDYLTSQDWLEIAALTYIRGRSIPNTVFIIDEAQSLTKHEMKTIVSRMGENSKLILIGDIYQIDNPYLDATNNGLTHVIEKFKSSDLAAHVSLTKGERSRLASVAAEVL